MGRMQAFLKSMTTTKRAKFKKHVLGGEDQPQTRKPTTPLSRETSPRANQMFTGVLPSRETGPHISQVLRQLVKIPERCEECGGEHPTCICIKRFQKLQKPETVALPTTDDDSTGSDTLCDSEESDNNKSSPPSTPPAKMVSFDLPRDETKQPIPELDEQLNRPSCQIQIATSQNDEADEH